MADKKRRNTPNTGNKRNNGRRKKKGRLKGLIAAELIVVVVLVMIVGHNLGLGTGITNFVNSIRKPAVEELDITGINSPYAVLMNAKSGKVIGDINGEEQMYPASMTKIMTTILAIDNLKDLNQEISQLENALSLKDSEYSEVYAEKQKYWKEKDNLVVYGMKLCKSMKDERSCLMELALKGNVTIDFKD